MSMIMSKFPNLPIYLWHQAMDSQVGIVAVPRLLIQQSVGIVDSGHCVATNTVQHLLYGIYMWRHGMSLKCENDFL